MDEIYSLMLLITLIMTPWYFFSPQFSISFHLARWNTIPYKEYFNSFLINLYVIHIVKYNKINVHAILKLHTNVGNLFHTLLDNCNSTEKWMHMRRNSQENIVRKLDTKWMHELLEELKKWVIVMKRKMRWSQIKMFTFK